MKRLFLPCIFIFALLITANAENPYKCIDSNGNTVFSSTPQEGMKCFNGESNEEPKSPNRYSKTNKSSKTDLVEICHDLSHDLEDISAEITTLEKRRSELQREQLDIRQNGVTYNWNQKRQWQEMKPVNDKLNTLNHEFSILYQKKSLTTQDIRLYKCNELNYDLSKLNQKKYENNRNQRYRNQ
jgi:hypothetical protein